MSKINISLNNKIYSIDESVLASAADKLKAHLSNVMSGSGATINLGGTTYNIDSTKLTAATNDFVSHLGTIAGSGSSVTVNGVNYGVDSTKLQGAMSKLESTLGTLSGGSTPDAPTEERLEGDGAEYYTLAPTALSFRSTAPLSELQEVQINGVTVDPANYTLEEGSTIVTFPIEYLKTLNVGSYEVAVASNSKTVKGDFNVKAPELNEHGFYYNQPYAAYVDAFGGNTAVFIRNDGTLDLIVVENAYTETCNYTIADNQMTIQGAMGTFTASPTDNGNSMFVNELYANFVLGNDSITADADYIYVYKEDLGGYEVTAIDKTKAEYGAIKTGVNGYPTVSIGRTAFANCANLANAIIPYGITIIGDWAFNMSIIDNVYQTSLVKAIIPNSVISIGEYAFSNCNKLTNIVFEGTTTQWNAITKGDDWNFNVPATYVQCSDGQVML